MDRDGELKSEQTYQLIIVMCLDIFCISTS